MILLLRQPYENHASKALTWSTHSTPPDPISHHFTSDPIETHRNSKSPTHSSSLKFVTLALETRDGSSLVSPPNSGDGTRGNTSRDPGTKITSSARCTHASSGTDHHPVLIYSTRSPTSFPHFLSSLLMSKDTSGCTGGIGFGSRHGHVDEGQRVWRLQRRDHWVRRTSLSFTSTPLTLILLADMGTWLGCVDWTGTMNMVATITVTWRTCKFFLLTSLLST